MQTKQKSPLKYISYVLIATTIISGFALSHPAPMVSADVSDTATARVTVSSACSLTTSGGGVYTTTATNGNATDVYANDIHVSCNDTSGFDIYTIGFSNNTDGDNKLLYSGANPSYDITSPSANSYGSYWKMTIGYAENLTINNTFASATAIPTSYTQLATQSSQVVQQTSFEPVYIITIGNTQPAGTYVGKVKYTIVHPQNTTAPTT